MFLDNTGKVLVWVAVAAAVSMSAGCASNEVATDRAHGCPIDAHRVVEYDAPAWLDDCDRCYKVTDRDTGQGWWLLVMKEGAAGKRYVALPILGGEE